MHSSPKRWRASEYASLITITPAPGTPRAACDTLRFVSAQSASNSAAHRPSSRRCAGSCTSGARSSHSRMRVDQLTHERGATLVLQRDVGDPPAVVLGAHPICHRHAHVGEEHLGELRAIRARCAAAARRYRAGPSAGSATRCPCAWRVGVGPHEELADVGDLSERAPDLLTVQHVVVAVALGARAQGREVGARARLGEALTPHLVAPQDLRQVRGLLLARCPPR